MGAMQVSDKEEGRGDTDNCIPLSSEKFLKNGIKKQEKMESRGLPGKFLIQWEQ